MSVNICRFPDNPAVQNAASGARPQNPCHLFSATQPRLQAPAAARQALAAGKHRQHLAARQGGPPPWHCTPGLSPRPWPVIAWPVIAPLACHRTPGLSSRPWPVIARNEAIHRPSHKGMDCHGAVRLAMTRRGLRRPRLGTGPLVTGPASLLRRRPVIAPLACHRAPTLSSRSRRNLLSL